MKADPLTSIVPPAFADGATRRLGAAHAAGAPLEPCRGAAQLAQQMNNSTSEPRTASLAISPPSGSAGCHLVLRRPGPPKRLPAAGRFSGSCRRCRRPPLLAEPVGEPVQHLVELLLGDGI
jgi:hypothetical protein